MNQRHGLWIAKWSITTGVVQKSLPSNVVGKCRRENPIEGNVLCSWFLKPCLIMKKSGFCWSFGHEHSFYWWRMSKLISYFPHCHETDLSFSAFPAIFPFQHSFLISYFSFFIFHLALVNCKQCNKRLT